MTKNNIKLNSCHCLLTKGFHDPHLCGIWEKCLLWYHLESNGLIKDIWFGVLINLFNISGSHVSWLNILISMQSFMWSSIEIYGIEWDHSSMEWKHNIFSQFIFCLLILLTWLLFFRNETHCRRMPCHVTWYTLIELQAIHQKDWEESKRTERSSSFWLDYNRISSYLLTQCSTSLNKKIKVTQLAIRQHWQNAFFRNMNYISSCYM